MYLLVLQTKWNSKIHCLFSFLLLRSDDLYETGLLWNGRLHQVTAQIPGVCFWDWDCILSQPSHIAVDGVHPSLDGNSVLHETTASRIQQMLSTDRRGQLM